MNKNKLDEPTVLFRVIKTPTEHPALKANSRVVYNSGEATKKKI